jgi:hypothetical protein
MKTEKEDTRKGVDYLVAGTVLLTGSQVYGVPTEKSDIDVVLMLPQALVEFLELVSEQGSTPPGSTSLRFGRLNLIIPDDWKSLAVWKEGTEKLKKRKPVSRGDAIELFTQLRIAAGIEKGK